jgi:hypothetical protein
VLGQEPLLPPSLAELELLLTVVPADWDAGADVVDAVLELEAVDVDVDDVVVAVLVPVAVLWLAANAVTPNSAAAPATVVAIATRIRVVRDRTGWLMHPGLLGRLSRTCRAPVPIL